MVQLEFYGHGKITGGHPVCFFCAAVDPFATPKSLVNKKCLALKNIIMYLVRSRQIDISSVCVPCSRFYECVCIFKRPLVRRFMGVLILSRRAATACRVKIIIIVARIGNPLLLTGTPRNQNNALHRNFHNASRARGEKSVLGEAFLLFQHN